MIQREPTKRLSAKTYLKQWGGRTFPKYFGFLYKFFAKLLSPELADADIKIQAIKHHDHVILREVVGIEAADEVKEKKARKQAGAAPSVASTSAGPTVTSTAPGASSTTNNLPAGAPPMTAALSSSTTVGSSSSAPSRAGGITTTSDASMSASPLTDPRGSISLGVSAAKLNTIGSGNHHYKWSFLSFFVLPSIKLFVPMK
jgi:hypothetical protein